MIILTYLQIDNFWKRLSWLLHNTYINISEVVFYVAICYSIKQLEILYSFILSLHKSTSCNFSNLVLNDWHWRTIIERKDNFFFILEYWELLSIPCTWLDWQFNFITIFFNSLKPDAHFFLGFSYFRYIYTEVPHCSLPIICILFPIIRPARIESTTCSTKYHCMCIIVSCNCNKYANIATESEQRLYLIV